MRGAGAPLRRLLPVGGWGGYNYGISLGCGEGGRVGIDKTYFVPLKLSFAQEEAGLPSAR